MEINWLEKRHCGRSGGSSSSGFYISHTISSKHNQNATYIRLGIDVMKKCRFLAGDRLSVGFGDVSAGKVIAVRRDPTGKGYTLSSTRGKKGYGSSDVTGNIKLTKQDTPSIRVPLERCVLCDDGTLLIPLYGE